MLDTDIRWLNGKGSDGMMVLQIVYNDNTIAYLKGDNNQINNYYDLFESCPSVAELVVYNVDGSEKVRKVCLTNIL